MVTRADRTCSRPPRLGRPYRNVAVAIHRDDLTLERARPAKKLTQGAPVRRSDDRVRIRPSLDAIPLASSLLEEDGERIPAELFPLVE
jgi:hypothetical protein